MDNVLIKLQSIEKSFLVGKENFLALKNVDLSIYDGEFVAIEGRSGCGKSTLLSIIGLLDDATSGNYFLSRQDVTQLVSTQKSILRNQQIGWIFQNFNLINDMTVFENVHLPLKYHQHLNNKIIKQRVYETLDQMSISDKAERYPTELSGGQQQRVAIARALVTKPKLILADEPTGNLDEENADSVFNLLQKINLSGVTVILVTHDKDIAAKCPVRCMLKDGRVAEFIR